MRKLTFLLIVLFLALMGIIVGLVVAREQTIGVGIVISDTLSSAIGGMVSGVAANPTWIEYGNYISFGIGAVIIGLAFVFGHDIYNKMRTAMWKSAAKESAVYQQGPVYSPQPIPTAQPQIVVTPTTIPQVTPSPQPTPAPIPQPEKKEQTA